MERMVIKHLSGSKANQVEEFSLRHHTELVLGRDTAAAVRYDPDRDDLVGRQHARITRDPNDENGFLIEDLNSRNGTFVNKQRVSGTVKLTVGDLVQLGPGGPEFVFGVEPRPVGTTGAKATRIAATPPTPPTRVSETNASANSGIPVYGAPASPAKPPGSVGKATVERMITSSVTETKKRQGRKFAIIGALAALGVLLLFIILGAGVYLWSARQAAAHDELNAKVVEGQKNWTTPKPPHRFPPPTSTTNSANPLCILKSPGA